MIFNLHKFDLNEIRDSGKFKDEADCFQQISSNLLEFQIQNDLAFNESDISKSKVIGFKTAAPDGAIDATIEYKSKTIGIVECKKSINYKSLTTSIKELVTKIGNTLSQPELLKQGSQYKFWIDKKEISSYFLLTSFQFENATQRKNIQDKLTAMFERISASPELSHLGKIKVYLYDWNDLVKDLHFNKTSKWFKVKLLPLGIKLLTRETFSAKNHSNKFSSYLSKLQYISRGQFISERPSIQDPTFKKESQVLEELRNGTKKGCLIFGEGGIGKTRLTLELGRKFSANTTYQVIQVQKDAKDINELRKFIYEQLLPILTEKSIVLLFDYIEESEIFTENIFKNLNSDNSYELVIIANCRNGFKNSSKINKEDFFELDISVFDRNQKLTTNGFYYQFVVSKLVSNIPQLRGTNINFFKRPIIAAFMIYMKERYPEESLNLVGNEDFGSWVNRRISRTLSVSTQNLQEQTKLFNLISIFPINQNQFEILYNNDIYRNYLDRLEGDGWLEKNDFNDNFRIIHDYIADLLIKDFFNSKKQVALNIEFKNSLRFSLENNAFFSWLIAMERIYADLKIANLNSFDILKTSLITTNKEFKQQNKIGLRQISFTSLLTEQEKVKLFQIDFFDEIIKEEEFALPLSFSLNLFSKNHDYSVKEELNVILTQWIAGNVSFIESEKVAHKILSTSLRFFGLTDLLENDLKNYYTNPLLYLNIESSYVHHRALELIDNLTINILPQIQEWIKKYSHDATVSFVIGTYLKFGGELEPIKEEVISWIKKNWSNTSSSFVINSFLKFSGELEPIKNEVISWVKKYWNNQNSSFLIGSYLKLGGELGQIKIEVINWINEYWDKPNVTFVIQYYFQQGGEISPIKNETIEWIKKNWDGTAVSFVIQPYFQQGGELEPIKDEIIEWIKKYWSEYNASFVIQPYFQQGGKLKPIEKEVVEWIKKNWNNSINVSFIIQPYLSQGGNLKPIESEVIEWIKKNWDNPTSSFVIQPYFQQEGKIEQIKNEVIEWIKKYWNSENSSFVIQLYLQQQGELPPIKYEIIEWIKKYWDNENSRFIIQGSLVNGLELDIIEKQILLYIKKNYTDINASFIIQTYFKHGGALKTIYEEIIQWLKLHWNSENASFVIQQYFNQGGEFDRVESEMLNWLELNYETNTANYIYVAYLRNGGNLEKVNSKIVSWIKVNYKNKVAYLVISNYLRLNGKLENIHFEVVEWIKKYWDDVDVSFILKPYFSQNGNIEPITDEIIKWIKNYWNDNTASFVIQPYFQQQGQLQLIEIETIEWIKKNCLDSTLTFVIKPYFQQEGKLEPIKNDLVKWIKENWNNVNTSYILQPYFQQGGELEPIEEEVSNWLNLYFSSMDISFIILSYLKNNGNVDLISVPLNYLFSDTSKKYRNYNIELIKEWLEENN